MLIETLSQSFRRVRTTDSTDSSYPSRIPTGTEPSSDGVVDIAGSIAGKAKGSLAQNGILLVPYAVGASNDTFSFRLIGWRDVGESNQNTDLWIPVTLIEFACTLGTSPGLAGTIIDNTYLFADTMSLTVGDAGVSVDTVSPADNTVAHAVADIKGFQRIEVVFAITSGVTAMNCLAALL